MTQHTQTPSMPSPLWQYWRGLSGWNFYFLVKFGLLWAGYLNFHPLLNLVFMAFLLMPIPKYRLHRLRHWIAIPVGFALFWHDTWLPGPQSIMSQGTQVAEFSSGYLLDLIARFINWQMIGAIFVLLVAWLFFITVDSGHGVCGRHHGMAECPDINRPGFYAVAGRPANRYGDDDWR
ncbi:cellulose synthase [Salmonella enterica subsp. enterica]|uniref:Cellulose synthase n=1 Tax=Salmonella enterica I TaxID=59201 RepID=A0A3S4LT41_SALET|nr:cellulose synthase [Salmonella enterica subsp. enterica]